MNLVKQVIWAELKLKTLEAAMMINENYTNDEVISKLMEVVELLDNTQP